MELQRLAQQFTEYMQLNNDLSKELGSSNIVGQWGEQLVCAYLNGELMAPSAKSADILARGKRYQVKTRQVKPSDSRSQLGTIRSWDFDYLAVVLIDPNGSTNAGYLIPVEDVRPLAKWSTHQNGWIVYVNNALVSLPSCKNITKQLRNVTCYGKLKANFTKENRPMKTTRKAVLAHFSQLTGEELKPRNVQRSWGAQSSTHTVLFAYTTDQREDAPELVKVLDVDPDEMNWSEQERDRHVTAILEKLTTGIVVMAEPVDPNAHPIRLKRFTEYFEVENVELAHGRVFVSGKRQALPEHLTK